MEMLGMGSIIVGNALGKQQRDYMRAMEELQYDEMCCRNYEAAHGVRPHPFMNMVHIRNYYSLPWRKSPIPRVSNK